VELTSCKEVAPIEDLQKAYDIVSYTCKPCEPAFIAAQYGKADLACKSRNESSEDIKLRSAVFAEQLAEFPADIIADAFNTWIRCEVFSPTVAQIRDLCWLEYRARYGMKLMIKKMLDEREGTKKRFNFMDGVKKNNFMNSE